MRRSRMLTSSLGLLAAVLVTSALALAPATASAGTVCSCPTWWNWQIASGSAGSNTSCPQAACLADAQANAQAACGFQGVCDYGASDVICAYIAHGNPKYRASCTLEYVCNICIDYPD